LHLLRHRQIADSGHTEHLVRVRVRVRVKVRFKLRVRV